MEGCQTIFFRQVRGAVTVMALLGVTWVSGALAIGPLRLPLKYVFCVSNSLQGFIIFIVRVVQVGYLTYGLSLFLFFRPKHLS